MAVSNFQTLDFSIFKHFEIWYPILLYLYLGSRISYRKVFVLKTKLWIPPFQLIMSQPSSMFLAGEINQKLRRIFFGHPASIFFRETSRKINSANNYCILFKQELLDSFQRNLFRFQFATKTFDYFEYEYFE